MTKVQKKAAGRQGLQLSAIGLGCMGMTAFYGKPIANEAGAEVIQRALQLGVTHLDTAAVYGFGTNETLVGEAVKGKRDQYTIATKCGFTPEGVNGTRAHVREYCDNSLRYLGTDYIDLFYLHRVGNETPVEETFKEFKALMDEGKIRHAGISEATAEQIRAAHAVCPLSVVQLEWSLFSRDAEEDIIPTCRELGIGIVAYSPLGRGYLSGAITKLEDLDESDWRRTNPRFGQEALAKNLELAGVVKGLAAKKGCTPAQLALAWVLAQGDDVFPIPGTTKASRLEENVGALDVKLTEEDLKELEGISQQVAGTRYTNMAIRL